MKIASYLRVGSNTTLNIILYAATLGEISLAGGKSTPGSLPKLGSAVQVCADYVRRAKQRRGNSTDRAELGEGEGVRLGPLLQRRKCQRPGPHIPG